MSHHSSSDARSLISGPRLIAAAALLGLLMVVGVVLVADVLDVSVGLLTRDITTTCAEAGARLPPYTGIISIVNITLWACAATGAVFVALLLRERRSWMFLFAVFLLMLAGDDALSVHEQAEEHIGLPEVGFYLIYAVIALVLCLRSVQAVRAGRAPAAELLALVLGGSFLAVSIGIDQLFEEQHLWEDGPKLIGSLIWLSLPLIYIGPLQKRLQAAGREAAAPAEG